MANIEFSDFTNGNAMQVGDQTVGLRAGANYRFAFPGLGIQDASGNYLLQWASAGALSVNYLLTTSSVAGSPVILSAGGSDLTVGVTVTTKGNGNLTFTPGGSGTINCSTTLLLSTSSPTAPLQAASKGYVDSLLPTYPITLAQGGTSASLTASNGGIFYSTATAGAILGATATANQVLLSGATSAPSWSTAVYPATTTAGQLLYSGSTNIISGLTSANDGVLVTSNIGVPSILAGSGNTGNMLMSNAASAPTWSAAIYSNTYTANNLLYASSTNNVAGLATAASGVLVTSAGGVPSISQTLPAAVQGNITSLGTVTSGVWNGTIIGSQYGGTGVNNGSATLTLGGNLTTSGAFASTFTMTGVTSVTFPTSGTLATTAGIPSLPLSLANGGTGQSNTASNGGIAYSTASAISILAGTATANQVLVSGSNTTPAWSTTPYLTTIIDVNGNNILSLNPSASAVNYFQVSNTITGTAPQLAAVGSDPNINVNVVPKGTGTFATNTTSNTGVIFTSGTGYQHQTNFIFANTSAARSVTFPDATGTLLMTGQAINTVPSITFSSTTGVVGTTTNDSAAAGSVGEYISSNVPLSPGTNIASNTATNLTSISLTAGDWDVSGNITYNGSSAISVIAWANIINTASATLPSDGSNYVLNTGVSTTYAGGTCITTRVSVASTTTVYLIGYVTLSGVTTCVMGGNISARRVR